VRVSRAQGNSYRRRGRGLSGIAFSSMILVIKVERRSRYKDVCIPVGMVSRVMHGICKWRSRRGYTTGILGVLSVCDSRRVTYLTYIQQHILHTISHTHTHPPFPIRSSWSSLASKKKSTPLVPRRHFPLLDCRSLILSKTNPSVSCSCRSSSGTEA
jgi:hypothetical protein